MIVTFHGIKIVWGFFCNVYKDSSIFEFYALGKTKDYKYLASLKNYYIPKKGASVLGDACITIIIKFISSQWTYYNWLQLYCMYNGYIQSKRPSLHTRVIEDQSSVSSKIPLVSKPYFFSTHYYISKIWCYDQ